MQRVRRLALVAVLAVVGGLVFSGCRSEPAVAAYVGDERITNRQIEKIIDQVRGELRTDLYGDVRLAAATTLIKWELTKAAIRDRGIATPPVDHAGYAASRQLPANWQYARVAAESDAYLEVLAGEYAKANPVKTEPTDADKREAYENARVEGQRVTNPYEQVKQLFDTPDMRAAVAKRAVVAEAIKRHPVRLNPRYGELAIKLDFAIQNAVTSLDVPVGPPARRVVVDQR